ncbi:uncharacterized protein LOC106144314 [Microtus ochrogaster]|uniref:Uncharacterized protein LOC106144314 n=1 Tax=Microtus ochrogaster TaxID=79684 RepID=A0ABM1UQU6_MICOH|nr:uncharacterized protein LOC106144314 [Microtus ochrogaster]
MENFNQMMPWNSVGTQSFSLLVACRLRWELFLPPCLPPVAKIPCHDGLLSLWSHKSVKSSISRLDHGYSCFLSAGLRVETVGAAPPLPPKTSDGQEARGRAPQLLYRNCFRETLPSLPLRGKVCGCYFPFTNRSFLSHSPISPLKETCEEFDVLPRRCNPRAASVRGKGKQEDKAILPEGASEATESRHACSCGFAEYHGARG